MARIWVGNIETDTSDKELRELLTKYGFPTCDAMRCDAMRCDAMRSAREREGLMMLVGAVYEQQTGRVRFLDVGE